MIRSFPSGMVLSRLVAGGIWAIGTSRLHKPWKELLGAPAGAFGSEVSSTGRWGSEQ